MYLSPDSSSLSLGCSNPCELSSGVEVCSVGTTGDTLTPDLQTLCGLQGVDVRWCCHGLNDLGVFGVLL